MNTNDLDAVRPVPTPNFPVTWDDPSEANLSWAFDPMHWPTVITPMTGQYTDIFIERGDAVYRAMSLPMYMLSRRINTYHYHTTTPLPLSPEEMAAQSSQTEARLNELLQNLGEQWHQVYLPEIQAHLAFWQNFDLANATMDQLLTHFAETRQRLQRLSEIHHLVQVPASFALSLFLDLYSELLGGETEGDATQSIFAAHTLLQGFDNMNRAADRALWELGRLALTSPGIVHALQQLPAAQVIPNLTAAPAAAEFLRAFAAFLQRYGQRSAKALDLAAPTWLDDPTPVIRTLQEYITQPDYDPAVELAAQVAERERQLTVTRQALQRFPQSVIDHFEALLAIAQVGVFVGEEHNYWIDQCMTYYVRQVMLEFGRRFAQAGVIDSIEDIFYLTFDEIPPTAAELPRLDRRALVAGRCAEMAYFRTIAPPPALGTLPPMPPADDPITRADLRFWGAPPPPVDKPSVLQGHGASAGVVQGRVKVVTTLAEAGKVQKGDILVAQTTQPAWTPLFAIAAAVVTDTGGILCHAAVVAREYGIPAVVGTGIATRALHDGQMVEVDGTMGVVRVII